MDTFNSPAPSTRPPLWRAVIWIVVGVWLCANVVGCVLGIPEPWGPDIKGQTTHGDEVIYRSRSVDRERDEVLIWRKPDGTMREFTIQNFHAGASYVVIREDQAGWAVWINGPDRVLCTLNLETGEFDNSGRPLPGTIPNAGKVLAWGVTVEWQSMIVLWLLLIYVFVDAVIWYNRRTVTAAS